MKKMGKLVIIGAKNLLQNMKIKALKEGKTGRIGN